MLILMHYINLPLVYTITVRSYHIRYSLLVKVTAHAHLVHLVLLARGGGGGGA